MRIALIAHGEFGKAILEAFAAHGDTVAGVLRLEGEADALDATASEKGVPVHRLPSLSGPEASTAMRGLAADIAVLGFMGETLPQSLLDLPGHGAIQIHASLLPRFRGPTPVQWSIARGEAETGITVIRPTQNPYEGPVILQRTCAIGPEETQADLYRGSLQHLGVDSLVTAAQLIVRGEQIEVDQDENAATYEGRFGEAEAEIHWANHAEIVHNLIRAANPQPGAWTRLEGEKLRILDVCLTATRRDAEVVGGPGEIASIDRDGFAVCAPGGQIVVRRVRPDGGDAMPAAEFAKARGLAPGRRFGG
jgi:methionyl-tRNA formyltransferase